MRFNPSRFNKSAGILVSVFILICSLWIFISPVRAVVLGAPVDQTNVLASIPESQSQIKQTIWQKLGKALQKAGSRAFQSTVRSALNKVAYDTATYVGSGGVGQQPLFITKGWGAYMTEIGDEAAGQFIEGFADSFAGDVQADSKRARAEKNCTRQFEACGEGCKTLTGDDAFNSCYLGCEKTSISCYNTAAANYTNALAQNAKAVSTGAKTSSLNLCSPSLNVKMKLAIGLVKQERPSRPKCTWSEMYKNWNSELDFAKKARDLQEQERNGTFYRNLANMFDPQSSDLSAALSIQTGLMEDVNKKVEVSKTTLLGKNGWIDPLGVGGEAIGLPDQAKVKTEMAQQGYMSNFGKFTGDALVDAGNTFLNQLAMTAFNKWINDLKGGKSDNNSVLGGGGDLYSGTSGSYDYAANQQSLLNILKPQFEERADYNVLGDLAVCVDEKNPGPNNCVVDTKFMEAISEQKTVGAALKDGSLNGSWILTADSKASSYRESYSLRNIMILRKFRILPVGWEAAIEKAAALGKNVTLMDMVSCFNPDDDFHTFSSSVLESNQAWCLDLIDPNWVLKAPQTYCAKSGFGNQITSAIVSDLDSTSTSSPTQEVLITRADDYCADEKTCIKEDAKGSCQAYGYCTEDRRTWKFGGDSCEPVFNSCETFVDNNGNTNSYLKNTLDYNGCSASNSGCSQYSVFGSYTSSTNQISWSGNNAYSIFLNDQAETCDTASEGCHSLIRAKASWGDNLIFNNDFSLDEVGTSTISHWPAIGPASIVLESSEPVLGSTNQTKILKFTGASNGLNSAGVNSIVPASIDVIDGYYYTLTAEIYLVGNGKVSMKLGGADYVTGDITAPNVWQVASLTAKPSDNISSLDFSILGDATTGTFYIRNLKLEANNYFSGWSNYGAVKTQEKLLPDYLAATCYINPFASGMKDYRLKPNAPAACNNFARLCNKDEVGCQTFSSADGFSITGKVAFDEYCPQECVNYNSYVQRETNFQSVDSSYFIPSSATSCVASAVGCSRFTNLDSVAQGGETNEYYSSLRRCIQPNNVKCAAFYSWGGDNETGYQLKAYSLQQSTSATGTPAVTKNDSVECSQAIFNLPPTSPDYNPDCRQFYDKNGVVSYHLYSRTISCSSDCRNLRLDEPTTSTECSANGGTWASSTCIYKALPAQSTTCSAAESGCREYNGNNGNNVRIAAAFDFENNTTTFNGAVTLSSASTNNNGHSLLLNGSAEVLVDNSVTSGSAYSLKFLAKGLSQGANLEVYFADGSGTKIAYFDSGKGGTGATSIDDVDWRVYQISLPNLNHRVEAGEKLVIKSSSGAIYLDSIVLTEITDRYYLIKNSWTTPDICYYDLNDEYRGAEYNLGCSAYQDPNGTTHNLRQFSSLCDSSSAGCELMIDTKNSASPFTQSFASSTISISDDQAIYAIFDANKQCSTEDIGCSRLGKGAKSGTSVFFSDVFVKNNPDNYDKTICQSSEVGCDTFYGASGGKTFFRNPFNNTCEYRASKTPGSKTWGWFKTAIKRCGNGGTICGSDTDCAVNTVCALDTSDYPCDVSYFKTIGKDSSGAPQPSKEAGLCEAAVSGCTEFIDASSETSPNLVINPSAGDLDGDGSTGDLWANSEQKIFLRARKLYVARSVNPPNNKIVNELNCANFGNMPVMNILGADNKIISSSTSGIELKDGIGVYFTLKYDSVCTVTSYWGAMVTTPVDTPITDSPATMPAGEVIRAKSVEVREALIEYQNEENIDTKSCGSKVSPEDGCVLFNRRAYDSAAGSVSALDKNVFASPNANGTFESCTPGSPYCNANMVVKATPNRVCSRWLGCSTKIKDEKTGQEYCYSLSECDKLSENGDCLNFIKTENTEHNFAYANDKNSTGYQMLNAYYLANMREVGNRSSDLISPINFEDGTSPFNWKIKYVKGIATSSQTINPPSGLINSNDDYQIIAEPNPRYNDRTSMGLKVAYPAEGKKFIEIPANTLLGLKSIGLITDTDYYLSYLVNTDSLTPGAEALVRVTDQQNPNIVLKEFSDKTKGWKRIVHHIKAPKDSVSIFFGTKQTKGVSGKVYFDDIKMEPVLQVNGTGDDSKDYVAKECRLYPGEESLTCSSRNENVIKNGWEGYCLKHDPINPGVCLQWLPLDNISSAIDSGKTAGYKGQYPLYYCAEANANFEMVEKRVGNRFAYQNGDITAAMCDFGNHSLGIYPSNTDGLRTCADGYQIFYFEYFADDYGCFGEWLCLPAASNIEVKATVHDYGCDGFRDIWTADSQNIPWKLNAGNIREINFQYPSNQVTEVSKKISSADSIVDGNSVNGNGCGHVFVKYTVKSNGWYRYNGFSASEQTNANPGPPVRIYDYNNPPATESELKYINQDNGSPEKTFTPVCNKFVKVLDEEGKGMPWVDRLLNQDIYNSSTPTFFPVINGFGHSSPNQFNLSAKFFGISLSLPYGAAMLHGANIGGSAAIGFLTQYNNNNGKQESDPDLIPIAGRPYGCEDGGHNSCQYLGYCSVDRDVLCLTYDGAGLPANDPNSAACPMSTAKPNQPSVKQTCEAFGFKDEDVQQYKNRAQKETLKNLFLKGLTALSLSTSTAKYVIDEGVFKIYDSKDVSNPLYNVYEIKKCSSTVRPDGNSNFGPSDSVDTDFCAIWPEIKNINLYRGDGSSSALPKTPTNSWLVTPGYYTLKFNTLVDAEQQPLGEITIDWGDGKKDKISNQDSHPDVPHVISHNYGFFSFGDERKIRIKITDNWGYYACFAPTNLDCAGL